MKNAFIWVMLCVLWAGMLTIIFLCWNNYRARRAVNREAKALRQAIRKMYEKYPDDINY